MYGFTVLQVSVMSGLKEDNWILISISAFNLLPSAVSVKEYEENLDPHR